VGSSVGVGVFGITVVGHGDKVGGGFVNGGEGGSVVGGVRDRGRRR